MTQKYTVSFSKLFAANFAQFTESDQDKVLDFTEKFEEHGLADFANYPGKVSKSWANIDQSDANYVYAKANNLWHYHVGIPHYTTRHGKYQTSDWVLHFQWEYGTPHIHIVDMHYHYTRDGIFYLPDLKFFEKSA